MYGVILGLSCGCDNLAEMAEDGFIVNEDLIRLGRNVKTLMDYTEVVRVDATFQELALFLGLQEFAQEYLEDLSNLENEYLHDPAMGSSLLMCKLNPYVDIFDGVCELINHLEKSREKKVHVLDTIALTISVVSLPHQRIYLRLYLIVMSSQFKFILNWILKDCITNEALKIHKKDKKVSFAFDTMEILEPQHLPTYFDTQILKKIAKLGWYMRLCDLNPKKLKSIEDKIREELTDKFTQLSKEMEELANNKDPDHLTLVSSDSLKKFYGIINEIHDKVKLDIWDALYQCFKLGEIFRLLKSVALLYRIDLLTDFTQKLLFIAEKLDSLKINKNKNPQVIRSFLNGGYIDLSKFVDYEDDNENNDQYIEDMFHTTLNEKSVCKDYIEFFNLKVKKSSDESHLIEQIKLQITLPEHFFFTPELKTSYEKLFALLMPLRFHYQMLTKKVALCIEYPRDEILIHKAMLLRHKILFVTSNLIDYVYRDVIERRFSHFHAEIEKEQDLLAMQEKHSSMMNMIEAECFVFHPVLSKRFEEICQLTGKFYTASTQLLAVGTASKPDKPEEPFDRIDEAFTGCMTDFIKMLSSSADSYKCSSDDNLFFNLVHRLAFNSYFYADLNETNRSVDIKLLRQSK